MTGRPSIYSEELAKEICRRLIRGKSLAKICRADDMPAESTVYDWLADGDMGIEPFAAFSERYIRARALQAEKLLDDCLDIADDGTNDYGFKEGTDEDGEGARPVFLAENYQRSKLRVDTRLKLLEKQAPKKYGPKSSVDMNVKQLEAIPDDQLDSQLKAFAAEAGVRLAPGGEGAAEE